MNARVTLVTLCLVTTACGVSIQDEPERLGTPATNTAPTPTVTQRPDHPPVSEPTTTTAVTPTP